MWFVLEANYNALVPLDTDASVNLDLNVLTRLQIRKAMVLLENDLFLSKLTLMFDKSRSKGHVRWWKKNSMIVRMWIWSHISSSAFAWRGMMEGQSPFPSPDLLRRRGWVFYHAQMNLIHISLLILHLILTQVKQLNPKIPPASAPHPEPSEYMCLVRFCGIA